MKDRLIELLIKTPPTRLKCVGRAVGKTYTTASGVADHLLANGVIVPPCKVGQTVFFPMETNGECESYVDVGTVFAIGIDERHTMWISVRYESGLRYYHTSDDFGKTVFFTKEEAEKALEERSNR